MKTQAVLEQRTDGRFRVTNLGWDRFYAEGATREEAEQKFRAVWVKSDQSLIELISVDSEEGAVTSEPETTGGGATLGDSPAWQKLQGSLSEEEHEVFMEGVQRRRRELDDLEAQWLNLDT